MNAEIDEIVLEDEGMLWNRIEGFMKDKGIKINKGTLAKQLRQKLNGMEDASELSNETKEKAIKLFQKIREAFSEA